MTRGGKLRAVVLAAIVLFQVFAAVPVSSLAKTTGGGNASISDAGNAPSVHIPDATIDDSTDSKIEVAYNATDYVQKSDIRLEVEGPNIYASADESGGDGFFFTSGISGTEGVLQLTIPAGTLGGGNHTLQAELVNASSYVDVARDESSLNVATPVEIEGYRVSETNVYTGQNVTVNATVNNPGSFPEVFTVGVYANGAVKETNTTVIDPGKTHVPVNVSFSSPGTYDVSPNDKSTTEITVARAVDLEKYTISDRTVDPGEDLWINVTLKNSAPSERTHQLQVMADEETTVRSPTISGGGTNMVRVKTNFSSPGPKFATAYSMTEGRELFLDGEITVTNPVNFVNATVSEEPVGVNEDVQVNVTLQNPSSSAVDYELSLTKFDQSGGQFVFETLDRTPTVGPNSYETVSFTTNFSSPGEKFTFLHHWGTELAEPKIFVAEDTTGSPNVAVTDVKKPSRAVVDRPSLFVANITNTGDAAGVYNLTLSTNGTTTYEKFMVGPNTSRFGFLEATYGKKGKESATFAGQTFDVNVTGPVVADATIEHVNGTTPSQLPKVDAGLSSFGTVGVQIANPSPAPGQPPQNLSSLGVADDTTFRINASFQDYTPRVLVSSGKELSWTRTNVTGKPLTNVSILVNPARIDFKSTSATVDNWDAKANESKPADFGLRAAILMQVSDGTHPFFDSKPSTISGMTVSTDAQLFRPPAYEPPAPGQSPRLQIELAASHLTADGKVNQGYYRAFLPDSLLDEWDVDSTDELDVSYSADPSATFQVTNVSGGMMVNLTHHYSAGTAVITADTVAPTVDVGGDRTVEAGETVNFDTSGSTDNDAIDSVDWDFGDGSTGSGATPSHSYSSAGTYTATVTVTDASGNSATETVTVTVEESEDTSSVDTSSSQVSYSSSPDIAVVDATLGELDVESGVQVPIEATLENDGTGDGTYEVELLVDGSVVDRIDVDVAEGDSETVSFTRTFEVPGTYDVSVSGTSAGTLSVEAAATPTETTTQSETDTATPTPEPTPTPTASATATPGSDATSQTGPTTEADDSTATTTANSPGQPGFGVGAAIVAILSLALFVRRRDH